MLARVIKSQAVNSFTPFLVPEIGGGKPAPEGVGEFVFPGIDGVPPSGEVTEALALPPAPSIEDVLQHAHQEAAQIVAQAEHQSAAIEERAREKAMADARGIIEAENSVLINELRQQLADTISQISALAEEITTRVEKDVVELALAIAKKVVAREVTIDREVAFALVKVSLAKLHNRSVAQVHLNPEDFNFVESHRENLGFRGSLELIEDRSISMGGCLIHTETGEIDGRIKSQFDEITHGLLGEA